MRGGCRIKTDGFMYQICYHGFRWVKLHVCGNEFIIELVERFYGAFLFARSAKEQDVCFDRKLAPINLVDDVFRVAVPYQQISAERHYLMRHHGAGILATEIPVSSIRQEKLGIYARCRRVRMVLKFVANVNDVTRYASLAIYRAQYPVSWRQVASRIRATPSLVCNIGNTNVYPRCLTKLCTPLREFDTLGRQIKILSTEFEAFPREPIRSLKFFQFIKQKDAYPNLCNNSYGDKNI